MQRKKIDLKKVMESLKYDMPVVRIFNHADRVQRLDFTRVRCPNCQQVFKTGREST